ncbi:hypothetical protein PU560_11440, partial [Georgenia sp. 10Sc9-8]|nr:hypothetical protein [Georgenia halotolerans]
LAGAVLALLLAVLPLGRSDLGTGTVLAVLLLVLAPLGALLGAVVALVLDRRSMRSRTGRGGPARSQG